ncbi:MAG: hypothetical protein FH758_09240 [Firmicutes bacterium]|nr:hypothetical protein [Bacillota bacterium]
MNNFIEDISKSLSLIEELAGQHWLEEWVHSIRDQHGRQHSGIPVLAEWWLKAGDELASMQLTGSYAPSESTLRLTQLGFDLSVLKSVVGFNEQVNLLKGDKETFLQVCYRLSIASEYVKQGHKVILAKGQEKEDFLIHHHNDIPVAICAPSIKSINELDTVVSYAIDNTLSRLPENKGKVYVDFPLPSVYTAEQWLQLTEEIIRNNKPIPESYEFTMTSTFVDREGQYIKLNRHYHKIQ